MEFLACYHQCSVFLTLLRMKLCKRLCVPESNSNLELGAHFGNKGLFSLYMVVWLIGQSFVCFPCGLVVCSVSSDVYCKEKKCLIWVVNTSIQMDMPGTLSCWGHGGNHKEISLVLKACRLMYPLSLQCLLNFLLQQYKYCGVLDAPVVSFS